MTEAAWLLTAFGIGVALTLIVGIYCLLSTKSLIRTLIGLEIVTKSVTLLLVLAGYLTGQLALAQALVITLIIIEVAVIVAAISIVLVLFKHDDAIDASTLNQLRG